MPTINRYFQALSTIPAPGGNGCHPALLSGANLGIFANLPPERIFNDLRQAIPPGGRRVNDREILDAVNKAIKDHQGGTFTPTPRPKPVVNDGKAALQRIIAQAEISTEVDLWENSPIRLLNDPKQDPVLLLQTLFKSDDLVWIGERHEPGILEKNIRTASAWDEYFQNGGATSEHIIINPLTGLLGLTKSGEPSYRADACIKDFRHCLVEFDTLSHEDQIKFWSAVKLPIVALIDSGGKSIHAWLDVKKLADVTTPDRWATEIKGRLYEQVLAPLGIDRACSNPARLSRLPGHLRQEKQSFQKFLWLSAEGRPVC